MLSNPDPMDDSFGFVLATAARLMRDRFECALREADLDITPGEARTLALADRLNGPRQTELASALGIEPMSLVGYLDSLEKRELIERSADPRDRRVKLIFLTEKAKPELRRIRQIFQRTRQSAMRNFSETELTSLQSLLARLSNDLMNSL